MTILSRSLIDYRAIILYNHDINIRRFECDGERQKIILLKLYEYLLKETDEDHPISRQSLAKRMSEQGFPLSYEKESAVKLAVSEAETSKEKIIAVLERKLAVLISQNEAEKQSILSENQLRIANNKAQDLSIKKLTRNNPTMKAKFDELKES